MNAGLLLAALLAAGPAAAAAGKLETFRLANGLRVVIAPDPAVPVAAVSMIFDVGARQEPRGRSGFAHLFEHLMFEGSAHAPKGVFDRTLEGFGGDNNASTHEDFTFYYEVLPANAVPIALWLDADRLSAPAITEESFRNQVAVVKEEKRLRVDNEAYGPLLYVEVASRCFQNWTNNHSVIGTFEDLDAASLRDVKTFFDDYYAPKNGWLAVVGGVDPAEARRQVERYFAWIPNRGAPKAVDSAEPPQRRTREFSLVDQHANAPALVLAWTGMPRRRSAPDFYALGLLGRLLFNGKSSRLYQSLVKERQVAIAVDGSFGFPISDPREYREPGLFGGMVLPKAGVAADAVRRETLAQVKDVATKGVSAEELERVKTKFRSDYIREGETSLGRAERLLIAALLDGAPEAAEGELGRYLAVTPQQVKKAAAAYLRDDRLNVFDVRPAAKPDGGGR